MSTLLQGRLQIIVLNNVQRALSQQALSIALSPITMREQNIISIIRVCKTIPMDAKLLELVGILNVEKAFTLKVLIVTRAVPRTCLNSEKYFAQEPVMRDNIKLQWKAVQAIKLY